MAAASDQHRVWKGGSFIDDRWRVLGDEDAVPADLPVIVSLARWREERDALAARNAPVGVEIAPGSDWSDLRADLPRFPVIVVTIPKFADGRAFSIARLLRERDGYAGEIRAVGAYIIDQVPLMMRVGIDAFATADPQLIKAFESGLWPEVPHYLQPAWPGDGEAPAGTRPWIRRRAGAS